MESVEASPAGRKGSQRARRAGDLVANPAHVDNGMVHTHGIDGAAQFSNHALPQKGETGNM